MKVLVYGGTGAQGSAVVRALLEKGHEAYILTRDGNKAKELVEAGAKIKIGNTNNLESLVAASEDMDAISLMTPLFTDVSPEVTANNAIKAAQQAQAPFIVWNTSGQSKGENSGNPLLDHQAATTEMLEKSGLKYIKLVPTIYAENLLGPYTAPFVGKENKLKYPTPTDMAINWLPMQDLGHITVAALEKPALSGNTYSIASTERLNGPQLAAAFSEGLGRAIVFEELPTQEFGEILNSTFGEGAGHSIAKEYQGYHDDPSTRNFWHADTQAMQVDLGVNTTPIAEWVKQYAVLFS
ncbi:MAG: NmrA family NAD(P)-binding protein [Bacteroidota bacterium]